MYCRHCKKKVDKVFIDLGVSPPSNNYLKKNELDKKELYFPLNILVCKSCWLVQTEDFTKANQLFSEEYAYFSSYSSSWLRYMEAYSTYIIKKLNLNKNSLVIEVASNDGYLLQFFKNNKIPCLGIEPTKSTAMVSRKKGIKTITEFFGRKLAIKLRNKNLCADLIIANNVLAHVPNINDFLNGFDLLLKKDGIATFEFPHLINLVKKNQFDTIYHEHFSYFSFTAINLIMQSNNLEVFDVIKIPTHGGSLRVYVKKRNSSYNKINSRVIKLLNQEEKIGVKSIRFYNNFSEKADLIKKQFIIFIENAKRKNKKIAAYGAAAKGNTLLNFSGIKSDSILYVVDKNPAKQNKYLPGSHIKIVNEEYLKRNKPDYIIIFPWNLKNEIIKQLDYVRDWNAKFVTVIPSLKIF